MFSSSRSAGLFVPLYINAKLTLSPLCVDDDGITITMFGRTWKSMKWHDVKEVRSALWTDVGYSRPTQKFVLYSTSGERFYLRRGGPIIFNETINGFGSLWDILHEQSRLHGFTIAPFER